MELTETIQQVTFQGEDLTCRIEQYVCGTCGLEVATKSQVGNMQKTITDAYRVKKGLMTGQKIKAKRTELNMTQKDLADVMSVGIASIERWEGGIIQTAGMDKLLRQSFWPREREVTVTGNRPFSMERVKLALVKRLTIYMIMTCLRTEISSYTALNPCGMPTWLVTENLAEA